MSDGGPTLYYFIKKLIQKNPRLKNLILWNQAILYNYLSEKRLWTITANGRGYLMLETQKEINYTKILYHNIYLHIL